MGFISITLPSQNDSLELPVSATCGYANYIMVKTHVERIISSWMYYWTILKQLENVTVKSTEANAIQNTTQMSSIGLSSETIKGVTGIFGRSGCTEGNSVVAGRAGRQ